MGGAGSISALRQAFGAQGSGAISILSDPAVLDQVPTLRQWQQQFPAAEKMFSGLEQDSPFQKASTSLADFNSVLIELGKDVLPPVTAALRAFDGALRVFLPKSSDSTAGG